MITKLSYVIPFSVRVSLSAHPTLPHPHFLNLPKKRLEFCSLESNGGYVLLKDGYPASNKQALGGGGEGEAG